MPVGVRVRFEVFKRDDFTCRYCGRRSPEVVLEVDHIIPRCDRGPDDPMNLATSCWECNSGKSGVPLDQVLTGEDPHDRAILLLEKERQLREYNRVLAEINTRIEREVLDLASFWPRTLNCRDESWIRGALLVYPSEEIRRAMSIAINTNKTGGLAYVNACLRNWKARGAI